MSTDGLVPLTHLSYLKDHFKHSNKLKNDKQAQGQGYRTTNYINRQLYWAKVQWGTSYKLWKESLCTNYPGTGEVVVSKISSKTKTKPSTSEQN